jgi:adenosine deaminase
MEEFIRQLPKAELHLHIEGTLEPQLMFELAARNEYELPFSDVESVAAAYKFRNLQSFLDIYYQGAAVLQTPDDFYDLITAYFDRAAEDGVRRAEIFFDLGGEAALATIQEAESHLEGVIAVGLDSSERGYPPEPYAPAYEHARSLGLRAVAHAGEEGPPDYVVGALEVLGVERVDHGVRSMEEPELVARLRSERIPLTICPLSNVALRVVDKVSDHPLPRMMEEGLLVSVNSDDPAYFGGYVGENYSVLVDDLGFGRQRLELLAANSIESSFLSDEDKTALMGELEQVEM